MTAQDKVSNWWRRHATETHAIADEIRQHILQTSDSNKEMDSAAYARIVMHVYGVHLGFFNEARVLIKKLMQHDINRPNLDFLNLQLAILDSVAGHGAPSDQVGLSDRIRIQAGAVQIHVGLKQTTLAKEKYQNSLLLMKDLNLPPNDPGLLMAYKAMAISSNNLACQYEEEVSLSESETQLMLQAAHQARNFWERVGGWLEVERAEYRLAQSYLKAGNLEASRKHAQACLELCEANQAPPLEYFFAYQALALAAPDSVRNLTQTIEYFKKLNEADKSWCEAELNRVKMPKI